MPFAAKEESPFAASTPAPGEDDEEDGPFTGASPFVGVGAGDARVDETRIDTNLRVDADVAEELSGKSGDDPKASDADDEPADSTKVDEFRLNDLADEETRVQALPDRSAATDSGDDKTDESGAGSRSAKGKK